MWRLLTCANFVTPFGSLQHTFADNSRIMLNTTDYDGNATEYGECIPFLSNILHRQPSYRRCYAMEDWVVNTGNITNTNANGGELVMILTEDNGGTRLSSTRYVHYGTITTRREFPL